MARLAEQTKRATSDMLASQLDELIASASDLLDELNDQRSDATSALRSRVSRNLKTARDRLDTLKPQVVEGATQAARAAAGFARSRPWSTAAIGGVLVASLALLVYAALSDD